MLADIDVRALAERHGPERAYLSVYLTPPFELDRLSARLDRIRHLLADDEAEREHFEQSLTLLRDTLGAWTPEANVEGVCAFASWADDLSVIYGLEKAPGDLVWVDASPYVRPLAELQDEYETFAVVAADNTDTRVYLVTSAVADQEARVKGDVKNSVKKGGWSQKRYARRREKQLHTYAQEVADVLRELDGETAFDRIVLLGSDETMQEIRAVLPGPLAEKVVAEEAVSLDDEEQVWDEAFRQFFQEERAEEEALWETVRGEYLRGGRAAAGADEVLKAAAVGRVEALLVARDAEVAGVQCRACENTSAGEPPTCPVCGADDVFHVDLVNELVEMVELSSGRTEFADPMPGLADVGHVAALLRY